MSRGEGVNTRDQDEATDRLMRRVLARAGAAPGEVCPAADIVAAYAERRLTPQEAAAFESHAAACGRCQEILALLCELPASLPELVPAPSSALWRYWRWVLPAAGRPRWRSPFTSPSAPNRQRIRRWPAAPGWRARRPRL